MDTVERVVNPETRRWITVGGATYWDLVGKGYKLSEMRRLGSRQREPPQRRQSKDSGVRSVVPMMEMRVARGKNRRSRSWTDDAPRRGRERHALLDKCGRTCFLNPDNEAFPVCSRLGIGQDCDLDCRGVYAAKLRARQWGYENVEKQAEKLRNRKCRK